jgi:hypothetical protein
MNVIFRIFLISALLIIISQAEAQDNKTQAGFRFGNTTGFSGRIITENNFAFEGILGFRSGGMQIYGLFETRKPVYLNRLENMFLYFGAGAHIGFVRWNEYDQYYSPYHTYYDNYYDWHLGAAFGLDGIIGMEYAFNAAPISMAVDFKPFFELYGPFLMRVNFWDFGFHVRYNF